MDTRYDPNELRNACLLINTSDYCQVTASQVFLLDHLQFFSSPSLFCVLLAGREDER